MAEARGDHARLASRLDTLLQKAIDAEKSRIKSDKETSDIETDELFDGKRVDADSLNEFLVVEDGVKFYYDFAFPHVIQALEPDNEYHLTWSEIKPFVKPGGLLATFVR